MDLKKYHTIKITLNALILLVLIGCSSNQLKVAQPHQIQNEDSFNVEISSAILSSSYSESEYKLIEKMFAFKSFSEENFNELDKIIDRNDLSNKDKSTLNILRNELLEIKSNLNRKIEITAPNELKEIFIESIFRLPYNFELSFNDTKAIQFLRSNELFCNSLELDSLKTIAKTRSSENQNITVITNYPGDLITRYLSIDPNYIFLYNNENPQEFATSILEITKSNERFKKIERLAVPINIEFTPRIRKDLEVMVFDADHEVQKKLIPAFKYNFANKLLYYSSINALKSNLNKGDLIDYEGVNFSAPQFYLQDSNLLYMEEALKSGIVMDWLVLKAIKELNNSPKIVNGYTGLLIVGNTCTERLLSVSKLET